MKTVLVFGTFDGIHPGHEAFLRQASELGEKLIVCVAQDEIVKRLKQRSPSYALEDRLKSLRELSVVTEAKAGDLELGAYRCYLEIQPDVVAFGYDQEALLKDFKRFQQVRGDETPTVVLKPYQPETYKTSLLRP